MWSVRAMLATQSQTIQTEGIGSSAIESLDISLYATLNRNELEFEENFKINFK